MMVSVLTYTCNHALLQMSKQKHKYYQKFSIMFCDSGREDWNKADGAKYATIIK